MDNGMAPGLVVDQGLCYPADPNYYGYYCTGFESPVEWDDHHKFFSSDGSDVHYSGLQNENIPYVYYTPSYEYAQSPYNPYNPYIPGAVVGADSPFVGTQQYYANPTYQHPVSSSAFVPVYVQPGSEIVPNTSLDPNLSHEGASIRTDTIVPKHIPTASAIVGGPVQKSASGNSQQDSALVASQQLHIAKLSGSKVNMTPNKPSLGTTSGNTTHPTPSQDTENRSASGLMQSADNFSHGKLSSLRNQLKVTVPDNGFVDVASNGWGWTTVDKFRPGLQYGMMNENRSTDMLSEQNRGPRTNRLKGQWASSIPVKAHSDRAGASNVQENIIIYADQFNKEDFSVNYPNAKFFVIKSYSEDDVHKSIKYNVWSSTSSGNKKLATAYEDAQRISAGNPKGCPIFLFFSVNASGQFCGVAEMVGPVDFHKDMDFWQQDKWTGSFPVKWHIVKDVPNTNFRNIILENNENKPVTNSRDTQEITFVPGIMMLNIFKNSPLKTSLLDDFMYYEERQKIQQEEKSRFLGRTYDGSFFVPATVPSNNLNSMVIQPSKTNGTADQPPIPVKKHIEYKDTGKTNDTFNQPPNSEEKHIESDGAGNISTVDKQVNLNSMVIQPLKTNGKADQSPRAAKKHIEYKGTGKINDTFNQPPKSEEKHIESDGVGKTSTGDKQVRLNGMVIQPAKTNGIADQPTRAAKKHIEYKVTGKINDTFNQPLNLEAKHIESDGAGNTSIKDKQVNSEADGARPSKVDGMKSKLVEDDSNVNAVIKIGSLYIESKAPVTERDTSEDVVTVGTIPVKINGFKAERFPVLTVGTIPLNPGAFKRDN